MKNEVRQWISFVSGRSPGSLWLGLLPFAALLLLLIAPLARLALTETGMGVFEDKVLKNHFASEYIYHKYKDEMTCGVLSEEDSFGTLTIAAPIGIVAGINEETNTQ